MKIKKLLFMLLSLSGCGQAPLEVDAGLQEYADRFMQEGSKYGFTFNRSNGLVLKFAPQASMPKIGDGTTVAYCASGYYRPEVRVSQEHWDTEDDSYHEQTIMHELGHCLLNRTHDEIWVNGVGPESIMYPMQFDSSIYNKNRAYYIKELFIHK